jgi:hypothetical protein
MNTTNNDGYMSTNKNFNDDCFGLGFPFQLTDSGNDLQFSSTIRKHPLLIFPLCLAKEYLLIHSCNVIFFP